jgi:hypothetical protein
MLRLRAIRGDAVSAAPASMMGQDEEILMPGTRPPPGRPVIHRSRGGMRSYRCPVAIGSAGGSCSEWLPPPAPAHYQVTREQRDDDDDDESHADFLCIDRGARPPTADVPGSLCSRYIAILALANISGTSRRWLRAGGVDDVAAAVLYLASAVGTYLTGTVREVRRRCGIAIVQQLLYASFMSVGFRPTEEDLRVIEANRREDEKTSDVIRRALRLLDREAWEERARADMHRLRTEDLSTEADAWEYDADGNIRIIGTDLTVPARSQDRP